MITRAGNIDDVSGIVTLQKANLYENLSNDGRKHGFVTTAFSEQQLTKLISQQGIFVAEKNGAIEGYAMAGAWDFWSPWPIFPYMLSRLGALSFQGGPFPVNKSFQ